MTSTGAETDQSCKQTCTQGIGESALVEVRVWRPHEAGDGNGRFCLLWWYHDLRHRSLQAHDMMRELILVRELSTVATSHSRRACCAKNRLNTIRPSRPSARMTK
eukprot:7920391-Alexandrium_andersonii.AAC.1